MFYEGMDLTRHSAGRSEMKGSTIRTRQGFQFSTLEPSHFCQLFKNRRDNDCHSECGPLRRQEPGHEEAQIAKEAKGLLIGLAIIFAVSVISVVVANVY